MNTENHEKADQLRSEISEINSYLKSLKEVEEKITDKDSKLSIHLVTNYSNSMYPSLKLGNVSSGEINRLKEESFELMATILISRFESLLRRKEAEYEQC